MMTEMTLERLRAHRSNIHRYQRLLATRLSGASISSAERRSLRRRSRHFGWQECETFPLPDC